MRLSIFWKLLIPIVLVVTVLASGLLWVQLRLLDESFRRRASGQMAVATEVIKAEQHDLEEQALLVARNLSRDHVVVQMLLAHDQSGATAGLASVASANGMPTLAVFDARGRLFAATWPAQADHIPPQISGLMPRALAGEAVAGPVPSWRLPGQVAVVAIAPVRGSTRVDGVVVVEALVGNAFVDGVKHLTGLEVGVFLGDRRVVSTTFSKDGRRIVNERTPSRKAHQTLTEGQITTDEVTAGGRRFIARYVPLRSPAGPIIGMVGVGAPLDQIALDRRDTIRSSILASLLGLGFACAVTVIIGYLILTPLRRLTRSAEAIRRGTPEKADFTIATHDEVQDLSAAMAEMVNALQARERDLAHTNAALQQSSALLLERERELRAAKDDAERANHAKSEFLSRMSHELRTPLNGILGFGQLLEMDSLSPAHQDSVDQILKGGRHLLGLIDEVLDIARIESGRLAMSLEPVRVSDALQDALTLVTPIAVDRHVRFRSDQGGQCHRHVRADRQRLKQVILNLLSNAVKYNREGGEVTLSCEEVAGGRLRINVTDTGLGIPADKMGRLFTPFDRLGVEQTGIEGSGLGLSLSKHLTDAMGGALGVESKHGAGSTFWVELAIAEAPVDRVANADEPTPNAAELDGSQNAKVVLYIEDNLSNLKLIQRLLAHRPEVRLLPAMQGRLGLQLAAEHHPDLILLDLQLPDISGADVLRVLRDTPETREIPVVIISADATPGRIERLLAAGAWQYLTKPLDVKKFLAVLDEGLKNREQAHVGHTA